MAKKGKGMTKAATEGRREAAADALAALREAGLDALTPERIVEALRQDGIRDLEQLAARVLERERRRAGAVTRFDPYADLPETDAATAAASVHRPPEIPVVVDGTVYDPADVARFDGRVLHFVCTTAPDGTEALHASTRPAWTRSLSLYTQLRRTVAYLEGGLRPADFWPPGPIFPPGPIYPPPNPVPPGLPWEPAPGWPPLTPPPWQQLPQVPPSPPPPTESQFFSDIDFGGDWFWLAPGFQMHDLRKVDRNAFLFFSGDWNDVMSSLKPIGTVHLFEHIDFQGSSIVFPHGTNVPDLRRQGWNDRVSSVRIF